MLQRLYVHNYKAFQDFEFKPNPEMSHGLLIGKNGTGKSTIGDVLELLRNIGQGETRVNVLFDSRHLSLYHDRQSHVCFEVDARLGGDLYTYRLSLEQGKNNSDFEIHGEQLKVGDETLYERRHAEITRTQIEWTDGVAHRKQSVFTIKEQTVALPVLHVLTDTDPLSVFRDWLAKIIVLSPIPAKIRGESTKPMMFPDREGVHFANWLSGLLGCNPAIYAGLFEYVSAFMPDLDSIKFENRGCDAKQLIVQFKKEAGKMPLPFDALSDGEKCFFICATLLAANETQGPLLCFWDEPDNFMSVSEVGHFIQSLKGSFKAPSQILMTSHNMEAILKFYDENTWVITRETHLEPPRIRLLGDVRKEMPGDLTVALLLGDLF